MTTSPSSQDQTTGPRLAREQATMAAMMALYCHDHHGTRNGSCDDCAQLLDYARRRLATCPFGEEKPACNNCQVHCYSASQRERVRVVMRYAGPRMLFRHPILSLYHLLDKRREAPPLAAIKRERSAAGHSGDRVATKP
jgi:predicted amidophosphoribosyltransferase